MISRSFGFSPEDLQKSFENFFKSICIKKCTYEAGLDKSLEKFTTYRLIPYVKYPGLRLIDVEEVLRQTDKKIVMYVTKKDVQDGAGAL